MLSDMSRTLDAINAQKVDTQLLSRQRMPHSRALVKDKAVGGLKFPDNGTGVVASSLDDLNTLVDDHLRPHHARARMMMRRETPKIPKLRIDLLLCTNMGVETLAEYLSTTRLQLERWKLSIADKPASSTSATR